MEVLVLIIVVGVLWKVGVLATAKTTIGVVNDAVKSAAEMADNKMKLQQLAHQESVIKRVEKLSDISAERVQAASAKIATLQQFKL